MKTLDNIVKHLLVCAFLVSSAAISANAMADDSDTELNDRDGGYMSLGVGFRSEKSPFVGDFGEAAIFLNGRYQWHGLFVEAPDIAFFGSDGVDVTTQNQSMIGVGYNFHNSQRWNFDLYAGAPDSAVSITGFRDDKLVELNKRKALTGYGLRSIGNYGANTVQFVAFPFYYSSEDADSGLYASMWLAHEWQVKNWNLHGAVGIKYRASSILDYYYGISDEESANLFGGGVIAAYEAKAGTDYTVQLGASYPVSKHWVFRSYARYTDISDSITDSPLFNVGVAVGRPKNESEVGISINYVF